jgi:restriction system protein
VKKQLSRSNLLASKLIFAALTTLRDSGGEMKASDVFDSVPTKVELDDWALEIIESNGLPRWRTYVHFFSVDAVKSGFLQKTKGYWKLTPEGVSALTHGQEGYFLLAQQGYRKWRKQQLGQSGEVQPERQDDAALEQVPPEEQFDKLKREVDGTLVAEILERVKLNSWQFFERLVVQLLLKMGYGGVGGSGMAFQKGNDGGIDGFINQDKLGLDVVYVQAKRWADQPVGRPDIQQFVGALAGRQATRGVFITTSRFSPDAREYVKPLNVRVILIDGELLAQLMIEHDVGVATWKSYQLKRIDSDFFSDE